MCRYYEIIKYHLDTLLPLRQAPLQALIIIPFLEMRAYIIKTQKKKSFAIVFKTSAKLFGTRNRNATHNSTD